jgi:glycosyltransferase involved in cell wall biosynthesis
MAWWLQKKTGIPFIIHSHNIETSRFRLMHKSWWPLYRRYEGWIHRKAHHNFFISREDMEHAISLFRLDSSRCSVITYGVEKKTLEKNKVALRKKLGLDPGKKILLFNGTMDYKPNYDAVVLLARTIEPLLSQCLDNYRVLITGNRAPSSLIEVMLSNTRLHYAGYVEEVHEYYQAADLFLNPVSNDTGVKTKLIEAIANNCSAISTASGASGIDLSVCGEKIITVADGDWNNFAQQVCLQFSKVQPDTPAAFYGSYSWEAITARAAAIIKGISQK